MPFNLRDFYVVDSIRTLHSWTRSSSTKQGVCVLAAILHCERPTYYNDQNSHSPLWMTRFRHSPQLPFVHCEWPCLLTRHSCHPLLVSDQVWVPGPRWLGEVLYSLELYLSIILRVCWEAAVVQESFLKDALFCRRLGENPSKPEGPWTPVLGRWPEIHVTSLFALNRGFTNDWCTCSGFQRMSSLRCRLVRSSAHWKPSWKFAAQTPRQVLRPRCPGRPANGLLPRLSVKCCVACGPRWGWPPPTARRRWR